VNELIFFVQAIIALTCLLLACRLGRTWVCAAVAVCAVMMNVVVQKPIHLFGLDVTAGNVLFAVIFFATDLLNEHYGRREAQRAVWIGFAASVFIVVMSQCVLRYGPHDSDAHRALGVLFEYTAYPRIVTASMASFLIFQSLDVYVFDRIRRATHGRMLWLRNNGSTFLSQLGDTLFFSYFGIWDVPWLGLERIDPAMSSFRDLVVFSYLVKLTLALLDTPFIYLSTLRGLRPPRREP